VMRAHCDDIIPRDCHMHCCCMCVQHARRENGWQLGIRSCWMTSGATKSPTQKTEKRKRKILDDQPTDRRHSRKSSNDPSATHSSKVH
jgi:hypothetical protein